MLIMCTLLLQCVLLKAQDEPSLLDALGEDEKTTEYTTNAFKGSRVINAHSMKMLHTGDPRPGAHQILSKTAWYPMTYTPWASVGGSSSPSAWPSSGTIPTPSTAFRKMSPITPLSIGIDMETGDHVFQLHFSNAVGMNERAFLSDDNGNWLNGDIQFGFNLSRVFQIKKQKVKS